METALSYVSEITVKYKPKKKILVQDRITCVEDAYKTLIRFFPEDIIQMQEMFVVLYLNRSNGIIGAYKHSIGGITGTVADIRLILGVALKSLATSIIMAHNHPSGSLRPSRADEMLTSRIVEAAKYMDILVQDHLILGQDCNYFSFANEGLL